MKNPESTRETLRQATNTHEVQMLKGFLRLIRWIGDSSFLRRTIVQDAQGRQFKIVGMGISKEQFVLEVEQPSGIVIPTILPPKGAE